MKEILRIIPVLFIKNGLIVRSQNFYKHQFIMVTEKEIESCIINSLKKRNTNIKVNKKSDFHTDGLLDSFGVLELVHELENRFSFQFSDDDFKHPHFRTIYGMTQLIINQKQSL